MANEGCSYIDLLKTIAKGEGAAEAWLTKWAETTKDPALKTNLLFVAMREGEHSLAFRKRVQELSGEYLPAPGIADGRNPKAGDIACDKNLSDKEKFEALGVGTTPRPGNDEPDNFNVMWNNKDLDGTTGALLGRFITEERDSGKRLRACYETLRAESEKTSTGGAGTSGGIVSELERLSKLRTGGVLTEEEFGLAKKAMLSKL